MGILVPRTLIFLNTSTIGAFLNLCEGEAKSWSMPQSMRSLYHIKRMFGGSKNHFLSES